MDITCHHSSSAGNLYQIDDLIVEVGVPVKEIKRCLDFGLCKIRAALLTHEHMDHAKASKQVMQTGIDLYCSLGTATALDLSGHRLHIIEAGKQFNLGPWTILPFKTIHDCAEPLGFLLTNQVNEKLLFITDSHYSPWRFKGLTHIMIEAGFDIDIMKQNIRDGYIDPVVGKRTIMNHMSIQTAIGLLKANDLSKVREIHLLHLSRDNSNADDFKKRVQSETGKPTFIAPV